MGDAGYTQLTQQPLGHVASVQGPRVNFSDHTMVPAQSYFYFVQAVGGATSQSVSAISGKPVISQIVGGCGQTGINFWFDGGSGGTFKVMRGGTATGPFYAATEVTNVAGFIRTAGNPLGVIQYYKIAAVYAAGTMESDLVSFQILMPQPYDPVSSHFETVAPGMSVEWQGCATIKTP